MTRFLFYEASVLCWVFNIARTPQVRSRNYWVSAIKKPNQMANRTLNFEAGNGNWWGPRNHERKLLIGPEHTLHWIHWRISCSCVGKYGWKTVESRCNLVWFFDSVLWRELVVSLFSQNYEYNWGGLVRKDVEKNKNIFWQNLSPISFIKSRISDEPSRSFITYCGRPPMVHYI